MALPDESKVVMEEVISQWKDRGRGGGTNLDGTIAVTSGEGDVALPLGPGEWEDALGLPLCVVCQNVSFVPTNIIFIFTDKGLRPRKWRFWRRCKAGKRRNSTKFFNTCELFCSSVWLDLPITGVYANILDKDGASLIYTTPSSPSQLPTLVHSSLGIHSLLKKQPLKHNTIDRDRVTVPPNWDSWGKIRVLREGFDVEAVSQGWTVDLAYPFPPPGRQATLENGETVLGDKDVDADGYEVVDNSAVTMFENTIRNPSMDALQMAGRDTHSTKLEIETVDTQAFLGGQVKVLEAYRQKFEEENKEDDRKIRSRKPAADELDNGRINGTEGRVNEHIGPVQFNMGGIQVDADDMLQRLKVRSVTRIDMVPYADPLVGPSNIRVLP